ncbi:hypothetical protein HYU40_04055 [Candidatus Woesearchaeota archaeon]|nr:hypothetical protein [Candidatus Woesearchaeota archaeon]
MGVLTLLRGKYSEIIGALLLLHWVALLIDRLTGKFLYNLLWMSHIGLLLAAVGFLRRNNLLLSAALISVFLGHGLWIYDFAMLMVTGASPLDYSIRPAGLLQVPLTSHHLYLAPLLLLALWRQRKISPKGWMVASAVFAFASTASFLFVSPEFNVNCIHSPCEELPRIFPFLQSLELNPLAYFLLANATMAAIGFFLPNLLLLRLFRPASNKGSRRAG